MPQGGIVVNEASRLKADSTPVFALPQRLRDNVGKMEVSEVQNLFEADFEYGSQPMRWEQYVSGGGSIAPVSSLGGVVINVTGASGDLAVRQTRPYIRYQPGKTLYMASGLLFGQAYTNQRQRIGFFDDGNGVFFEQGDPTATNPTGMTCVYRSDAGGNGPVDTRFYAGAQTQAGCLWSDPQNVWKNQNQAVGTFTVNQIQMWWIEYAWYGAGMLRWGVMIGGEPYVLHSVGIGNLTGQTTAWARTGNLPVRYELRNIGISTAGNMTHYGVSVLAKGRVDVQRGFTYGYGMTPGTPARAPGASVTRFPLLSIRYRNMGTLEYGVDSAYSGANGILPTGGAAIASVVQSATQTVVNLTGTPLVANSWVGKYLFARGATAAISAMSITAGIATVTTTAANHYLAPGRSISLNGASPASGGPFPTQVTILTTPAANTFTFATAASGTVTLTTATYQTGQGSMGRIISNTTSALTVVDNVLVSGPMAVPPAAAGNYILGIIDRGQILPTTLSIFSSANCTLELIASTYSSPVQLTGATFNTMYSLGSLNSFAERDVSATALVGGEVVYNTPLPSGGLQTFDLQNFFPLYNNIQGTNPDVLTVAITTPSSFGTNTVGASIIAQEAMS
jgi:hypothetical protein